MDFGADIPQNNDTSSNEKPFDDEPFDAGIEADEQSDPKKYIEQLTGKLGQSLRKYTETQGSPDFELEKFAVNSLLSATHTGEMDQNDQTDIINKVKDSGKNGGDEEAPVDNPMPDEGGESENPDEDLDNIFNTDDIEDDGEEDLNEMALTDHNVQKLIQIYDDGDDKLKQILTRYVSYSNTPDRNQFLRDIQDEVGYKDLQEIFELLKKIGIQIPDDKPVAVYENYMLDEPKKNDMFQDGSNDKLTNQFCPKGNKEVKIKTDDGREISNCVKIEENLENKEKNGIFVDKKLIKDKLSETFNQDDMDTRTKEPTTKPKVTPAPTKEPVIKPSRRNKPFQPNVTPGVDPDPKAKA